MKRLAFWRSNRRTIRTRVLAIVLIPCVALIAVGIGSSAYLIYSGLSAKTWSQELRKTTAPSVGFFTAVDQERRLTMLRIAGDTRDSTNLELVRPKVDLGITQIAALADQLAKQQGSNGSLSSTAADGVRALLPQLAAVRQAVDGGGISREEAAKFFDGLTAIIGQGQISVVLGTVKSADAALQLPTTVDLFTVIDTMAKSNTIAAGGVASGGMTPNDLHQYQTLVVFWHASLDSLVPRMTANGKERYKALIGSAAYRRLVTYEDALIARGPRPGVAPDVRPLPSTITQWQRDYEAVNDVLAGMWAEHLNYAEQLAADAGNRKFVRSLIAGIGILLLALGAFFVAARLSNQLIRRLKNLRAETLELADVRLPQIVHHLRAGEPVNPAVDVPDLEYGSDEIGAVADAFNKAQRTAVAAAEQEARAREGMNAVFLNIAHRSQMVAHRQLEVLDEAERRQEDPQHLELLFRIDHLATRARRNAENLVILGGERPGRKWRNPVPLDEIARGAVSETENFARVNTVRLPEIMIDGGMVADLIHLLAELVDNATSFSPPGTRVEVRGNLVGRGVVIEVEDQGLGMTEGQRERLNQMLQDPPDFQVMALSRQMRLGLFVVAQLAGRHGIQVTLAESAYGGTRAIVLIPSAPSNLRPTVGVPPMAATPVLAAADGPALRTGRPRRPVGDEIEMPALPEPRQLYAPPAREPRPPAIAPAPAPEPATANGAAPQDHDAVPHDLEPLGFNGFEPHSTGTFGAAEAGSDFPAWPEPTWAPEDEAMRRARGHRPLLPPREPLRSIPAREVELDAAEPPALEPDLAPQPDLVPPPDHDDTLQLKGAVSSAAPYATPLPYPNGNGHRPPNGTSSHAPNHAPDVAGPPQHRPASGGRAPLPRRRKQANIAPQLAAEIAPPDASGAETVDGRSPEQVRDTMSAMLRGTRQGREERPDTTRE